MDFNMHFILRNLFTYHLKASWTPYTPYLIYVYHVLIPIKILKITLSEDLSWNKHYIKLSLHVYIKCWD